MATPLVTAVVVTFQSADVIAQALAALSEVVTAGKAKVVVVDNASSDGTADVVRNQFPWARLIANKDNLGYGRGCNVGATGVDTPFILIVNPDTIVNCSTLDAMLDFMDRTPAAGIVGPAILEDDQDWQAAGLMTTPMTILRASWGSAKAYPHNRLIQPGETAFRTPWVCGAIMLLRTELFQTLGGFDPRFFLYFEETDLCRRAASAGSEIWAVGDAVASHVGGASASQVEGVHVHSCIAEHFYRSRFYYLVKHFGWVCAIASEVCERAILYGQAARNRLFSNGKSADAPMRERPFLRMPARPSARS